jgi:hypothetical protein
LNVELVGLGSLAMALELHLGHLGGPVSTHSYLFKDSFNEMDNEHIFSFHSY